MDLSHQALKKKKKKNFIWSPSMGLEPMTRRLRVTCSRIWASQVPCHIRLLVVTYCQGWNSDFFLFIVTFQRLWGSAFISMTVSTVSKILIRWERTEEVLRLTVPQLGCALPWLCSSQTVPQPGCAPAWLFSNLAVCSQTVFWAAATF